MALNELRQRTVDELKDELLALRREQFNLRMQKASGQLGKPSLFGRARKEIARIKTVLSEMERGAAE